METWQPDKVLRELLAIDPNSADSYTLRVQRQATATEEAGTWSTLGEHRKIPTSYLRNA